MNSLKTNIPRPSINFIQSRREYRADQDTVQTEIKVCLFAKLKLWFYINVLLQKLIYIRYF